MIAARRSRQGVNPGGQAVVKLFDGVAGAYDAALLQRLVYRPNHDAVIAELRRIGPRRILDVGCGTGVLTARVARELEPDVVYGCDLSDGMLAKARARPADVGWHVAPAERLPFDDSTFDAVITTEAFHFFDQPAALAEFHRVLTPGGHLIVASWNARTGILGAFLRWTPVSASTPRGVRDLVQTAGFQVLEQRSVGRLLASVVPTTATVARRPLLEGR